MSDFLRFRTILYIETLKIRLRQRMTYTTNPSLLFHIKGEENIYWVEFYRIYRPFIFHIGKIYRFSNAHCDELVQRVMVSIFEGRATFNYHPERGKFRNYLWAMVKTEARKIIQETQKQHLIIDSTPEYKVEEAYETAWRDHLVVEAMEILKKTVEQTTFEIFYMSAIQERPVQDVAKALSVTPNYVYEARRRCIAHLRKIIKQLHQEG